MKQFDKKFNAVFEQYKQREQTESALRPTLPFEEGMNRRDEFLLEVGEEVAGFINLLAKSAQSKSILEVGTSYGYSTLWLAEAARATGGKVISLEISPEKVAFAKQKMAEAGLAEFVEFRDGDALESIAAAPERFDFVLLDCWKEFYVPCFELLLPKLNSGAWVVADNMIFPAYHHAQTEAYRARVRETGAFDTVLLPIGQGVEVSFLKN